MKPFLGSLTNFMGTLFLIVGTISTQLVDGKAFGGGLGNKPEQFKFYVAIATDRQVYTAFSRSYAEAVRNFHHETSRTFKSDMVMECGTGWYATWKFEISDGSSSGNVGATCGRRSKNEAITAALKACRRQGGTDCLRSGAGNYSSSVTVSSGYIDTESLKKGDYMSNEGGWCIVVMDGTVSGDCNLRKELTDHGVYFNE